MIVIQLTFPIAIMFSPLSSIIAARFNRFRLPVMLSMIMLSWIVIIISGIVALRFTTLDNTQQAEQVVSYSSLITSNLLIAVAIVFVTTLLGNIASNIIARRYAESVADALGTTIAGICASVLMPWLSIYLSQTQIAGILLDNTIVGINFNWRLFTTNFLLLSFSTVATSLTLMRWGTVSVLRKRKSDILGFVCSALCILLSIFVAITLTYTYDLLMIVEQNQTNANSGMVVLLGFAYTSFLGGMLTAGLTVGILQDLLTFFYFTVFMLVIVLLMSLFLIYSEDLNNLSNMLDNILYIILLLILYLLQTKSVLVHDKLMSFIISIVIFALFVVSFFTIHGM